MQSAHHPGKGRPKTAGPAVNYPENDGDYLSDSVQKTITKTDTRYGYWLFAFVLRLEEGKAAAGRGKASKRSGKAAAIRGKEAVAGRAVVQNPRADPLPLLSPSERALPLSCAPTQAATITTHQGLPCGPCARVWRALAAENAPSRRTPRQTQQTARTRDMISCCSAQHSRARRAASFGPLRSTQAGQQAARLSGCAAGLS